MRLEYGFTDLLLTSHAGLPAFSYLLKAARLRKARPIDLEFARALEPILNEWSGEADEEGYRDL